MRLRLGQQARSAGVNASFLGTLVMTSVAAVWWSLAAMSNWRHNQFHMYDLAVVDQVVWNTSQGKWFQSSFFPYNFLGQHFQPILAIFAVPFRAGADASFLVVSQAVTAAGAALLLYLTARAVRIQPGLSAVIVMTYLANPFLHRALDYDFHPETMIAAPVFGAALAAAHGHGRAAVLLGLLPLLFKEDAVFLSLTVAGLLGILRMRREALTLAALSMTWTIILVFALMPALRDGVPSDLVARYGYLSDSQSVVGLAKGAVSRPWVLLRELAHVQTLVLTGGVVLGTATAGIARPVVLVALLPGLALAFLSAHPEQHNLELHYGAELVPVAALITVVGVRSLRSQFDARMIGAGMLGAASIAFLAFSPFSPVAESPLDVERLPVTEAHLRAVDRAIATIPADAPVSAQSGLGPRLSHRETLGEFPSGGELLEWVIVDSLAPRTEGHYVAALADVRSRYELRFSEDGVEVFQRPPS